MIATITYNEYQSALIRGLAKYSGDIGFATAVKLIHAKWQNSLTEEQKQHYLKLAKDK